MSTQGPVLENPHTVSFAKVAPTVMVAATLLGARLQESPFTLPDAMHPQQTYKRIETRRFFISSSGGESAKCAASQWYYAHTF
eukprot:151423-Prorocentrum_minimum.AAC.2